MRKQVHVVAAIIQNEHDEILCALRSSDMTLGNYWEFPGGKIELNETKEQALIREIKEELNCEIEILDHVDDTIYEYEEVTVRLETYLSTVLSGVPTASEHAQLKWIKKDRLDSLTWAPADIPAVKKVMGIV